MCQAAEAAFAGINAPAGRLGSWIWVKIPARQGGSQRRRSAVGLGPLAGRNPGRMVFSDLRDPHHGLQRRVALDWGT